MFICEGCRGLARLAVVWRGSANYANYANLTRCRNIIPDEPGKVGQFLFLRIGSVNLRLMVEVPYPFTPAGTYEACEEAYFFNGF